MQMTLPLSTKYPLQSVNELIAYDGAENLLLDLLARFSTASGVRGVQPKVMVKNTHDDRVHAGTGKISVSGATHIVKGWDEREFPQLAANEFFAWLLPGEPDLRCLKFSIIAAMKK